MKKTKYLFFTLIMLTLIFGCTSVPQNQSLTEAHSLYSTAQSNPDVTNMAALELKEASDSLGKADEALSNGDSDDKINQLSYLAARQVGIAEETAKRKAAELAVTNATANSTEVRLEARTAEADAAKQKILQLEALNAKKTERGMVITLGDVLFSTDKAELKPDGVRNVQKLADFLGQYPQNKVSIEGHTDSTGTDSYNQGLSDRRASSVKAALMNMGISSDRIMTRGYGEEFPVASNDNAEGRQLNRRVEIVLSDENGTITPR